MTEEGGFSEFGRDGGAIDGDERRAGARATKVKRACDEFLAGAAGASDEDGGLGESVEALDVVEDATDMRAVTDESGEVGAGGFEVGEGGEGLVGGLEGGFGLAAAFDFGGQFGGSSFESLVLVAEFGGEPAEAEMGFGAAADLFDLEGFDDVIDTPGLESGDDAGGIAAGGEEENRSFAAIGELVESATGFEAVEVGHEQIEEDQVGMGAGGDIESGESAAGDEDFVAFRFKGGSQDGEIGGDVIDQEEARGRQETHCGILMVNELPRIVALNRTMEGAAPRAPGWERVARRSVPLQSRSCRGRVLGGDLNAEEGILDALHVVAAEEPAQFVGEE